MRLAVGNVVAYPQKQMPTGAFEKGHVLARDAVTVNNAIDKGAVLEIERK